MGNSPQKSRYASAFDTLSERVCLTRSNLHHGGCGETVKLDWRGGRFALGKTETEDETMTMGGVCMVHIWMGWR